MITHHVLVTALTGVPYATLRQWVRRGHLICHGCGRYDLREVEIVQATHGTRRVRREALDAYRRGNVSVGAY